MDGHRGEVATVTGGPGRDKGIEDDLRLHMRPLDWHAVSREDGLGVLGPHDERADVLERRTTPQLHA